MSRDTLGSPRHRAARRGCSSFVLLLSMLACGDGMSPAGDGWGSEATSPPAATDGSAEATRSTGGEATGPDPDPAEPQPGAGAARADGPSEAASSNPIGLDPPSGSDDGSASGPPAGESAPAPSEQGPPGPGASEAGSSEEQPPPAAPPVSDASPSQVGADGSPGDETSDDETTGDQTDEAATNDGPPESLPPGDGASLARGSAPTLGSALAPGPFDVSIVTDGLRDGPNYGSQTLHVPQGVEPPFAAVAIIPGRDELESSIRAWGPFLASHGIVALTFGTNDPGDGPDVRALALLDALETLEAENVRRGGPVEGQLALDHLGIMGWSAGGAAVLDVASSSPELKAAIALAPFSPGGQFPDDQVPTLFIAGSADPRAGGQSQGVFQSLPDTTPKLLFEVQGGAHEVGNDPANADGEVGLYGLSWLEVFLVGDARYRQFLEETPAQASDFRASLGGLRASGGP